MHTVHACQQSNQLLGITAYPIIPCAFQGLWGSKDYCHFATVVPIERRFALLRKYY
jgi:hypothetical protein